MAGNDPPERDMKDFEFIQLCKFRVSTSENVGGFHKRGKLIACSSNYGLLFYGTRSGFNVVKTQDLMTIDEGLGKERNKVTINSIPVEFKVDLQSSDIIMLDISGDGLYLAVITFEAGKIFAHLYDIRIFADKDASVSPFGTIPISVSQSGSVLDLSWNPTVYTMLAVCTSDGIVELIDVADKPRVIASLPASVGATCFCWSPKGKQLLVGKIDGTLSQFDHSLAEKKLWPSTDILNEPHSVLDVVWQSTHTFIAAYVPVGAQPSDQPTVILTSANKDKVIHINFYDVCFGNGEERQPQYYFHQILKWEMILIASSNATEATVIGKNLDDKINWEHWNLEDCSRAQLPLTADQNDSFPVGMTVDYSPMKQIAISETKLLPPCPVMYILSTDGILLAYYLHYNHKDAPSATTPPQALSSSGARKGVPGTANVTPPAKQPLLETPKSTFAPPSVNSSGAPALTPSLSIFGGNKPTSCPASNIFGAPTQSTDIFGTGMPLSNNNIFGAATPLSNVFGGSQNSSISGNAPSTPHVFGAPSSSTTSTPSLFGGAPATSTPGIFGASTSTPVKFGAAKAPSIFGSVPSTSAMPSLFGAAPAFATSSIFGSTSTPGSGTVTTTAAAFSFSGLGQKLSSPSTAPNATFTGRPPVSSTVFTVSPKGDNTSQQPPVFGQLKTTPQTQLQGNSFLPSSTPQTQNSGLKAADNGHFTADNGHFPQKTDGSLPLASHTSSLFGIQTPSAFTVKTSPAQQPVVSALNTSGPSISQGQIKQDISKSQASNVNVVLDSSFTKNILDEIKDFENQLKELRSRSRIEFQSIGTPEEKQILNKETEQLTRFVKEIGDLTKEQLREAQEQKNCCYNLFATAESCKMKHELANDPHHHTLLLSKKLDPASALKLKSLQQMSQAIEFGLEEVNHVLDAKWQEQWDKKKKEERLSTPTGDTIYKAIKNNNTLIMCNWEKMKKLEDQFMNLKMNRKGSNKDVESLTRTVLNGDQMSPLKPLSHSAVTLTSAVASGMTPEKISKLKDFLSQRKVRRVKSTTPTNLNLSRIVSQSPGKSPKDTESPQEQLTPVLKKHRTDHIQTPTGPPASSQVVPSDLFRGNSGPLVSADKKTLTVMGSTQVKSATFQQVCPVPVPVSKTPPTSFSGVAYFKQPTPQSVIVTKPALATLQSAKSPLGLPESARSITFSSNPTGQSPSVGQVGKEKGLTAQAAFYEDVTDENEEDDDYDDEDNGYEDEDEDEDDVGYDELNHVNGAPYAFEQIPPKAAVRDIFKLPKSFSSNTPVKPSSGQIAVGKDLFGSKFSSNSEKSGLVRSSSNGFNVASPKTTEPTPKFVFGSAAATTATSAVTTTTTTFGLKTDKSQTSSGTFGGTAVFGQKFHSLSSGSTTSVFGSVATPSKNVGFADVQSKGAAEKNEVTSTAPGNSVSTASTGQKSQDTTVSDAERLTTLLAEQKIATATTTPATTAAVTSSSPPIGFTTAGSAFSSSSAFGIAQSLSPPKVSAVTDSDNTSSSVLASPAITASVFGGSASSTTPIVFGGATTTTPSAFGSTSASTSSSLFGGGSATTTSSSILGGASATTPSSSIFGGGSATTPSSTIFGGGNAATTSSSVFGGGSATTPSSSISGGGSATTTLSSIFGGGSATTTSSSILGGASATTPSSSIFGGGNTATTSSSIFGGGSATTPSSTIFGGGSATTPSSTIFGGGNAATTSSSVFGGGSATTPSSSISGGGSATTPSSSIFGGGSATTTSSSIFGGGSATTTSSSIFGGGSATTKSSSIFGGGSATTTSSSIFGGGSATTTSSSIFGGGSATTPSSSIFGGGNTSTTSSSIFGGSQPSSVFGNSSTVFGQTPSKPLFGGVSSESTPTFGSSGSVFGGTSGSSTNVFGGSTSSGGGLFGSNNNTTSTSGAGLFGSNNNTTSTSGAGLFGSNNNTTSTSGAGLFGSNNNTTSTSGAGLFGSNNNTTSTSGAGLFGSNNNTTSTSGAGLFGSATSGGSTFGQTFGFGQSTNATSTSSSLFGQPSAFGTSSSTSGSMFGFGGLGGKPSEEKAKQNVFGTPQVFGGTSSQSSNLFGSGGGSTFGGSSSFSSNQGGFSSGSGVAASGFGVSTQQNTGPLGGTPAFGTAPSFGSSSVFGNKPAFGSSPAFGSAPAFGSSPTFASSASTFGSSSSSGGFGSFANVQAPTFGQLAQSSPSAPSTFGGFGSPQTSQPSGFGGFGSSQNTFGGGSVFGQAPPSSPGFGAGQSQGFGGTSFGNPAFSSYRG
ncbi:hypothetical protein Btru_004986 [Bulinus truncatus]|nr:hypothetical protein Btru_004986 [Bulinus truncatus]